MNISVIVLAGHGKPIFLPEAYQVIVTKNSMGRGYGILEGLKQVTGDVTLVLHGDTQLPEGWQDEVETILHSNVAGAFRLGFDATTLWTRLGCKAMRLHFRLRKEVWGDCAQFARTRDWKAIASQLDVPLMEDVIFSREMNYRGSLALSKKSVRTSAQKLRRPLRYAAKVLRLRIQFALGSTPETLYNQYYAKNT